ncbi:hypothetical protein BH762_gp015 [Gordonia phage OneUp]|uniref:Uncharacterized protein n=1 Tax=Gordonia phage OneUp TaxID=1838074 RepID=A0A166Y9R7_9CAUD|nr:hypothetical protein BH762_gp015 [Gordonia phage OneUp]ANA86503.1 hypothetical protein PBI_ONEUP_170 [Gordonia phage OneUp]
MFVDQHDMTIVRDDSRRWVRSEYGALTVDKRDGRHHVSRDGETITTFRDYEVAAAYCRRMVCEAHGEHFHYCEPCAEAHEDKLFSLG